MVLYFGQRFESATAAVQLVDVECEKCRTRYFFELARVGTASTSAPYGLGSETAEASAATYSLDELIERMSTEAELVPCPGCHWINEALVDGYRQSRYRFILPLAIVIATAGLAASIIGALFVVNGPQPDRWMLPWFLVGGSTVSIGIFAVLMFARTLARKRIQPNRHFPGRPRVPVGTPPALLLDEATQTFRLADDSKPAETGDCEWFEFQIGRHQLPDICCQCMNPSDEKHAYERIIVPAMKLKLPRCQSCARAAKFEYLKLWLASFLGAVLVGAGLLIAIIHDDLILWILAVCHALLSLGFAAWFASSRSAPARVAVADLSRGIVRLKFRHPDYRPVTMWSDVER